MTGPAVCEGSASLVAAPAHRADALGEDNLSARLQAVARGSAGRRDRVSFRENGGFGR